MPNLDWEKYYKPKHKFNITWTQNRETHTSGSIRTTYENRTVGGTMFTGMSIPVPKVEGEISSHAVVASYTIKIAYDGPVNIGDRQVREKQIPNYWNYANVFEEATKNTDISPDNTCCHTPYSTFLVDCITNLSCLCGLCCCVGPCFQKPHIKRRQAEYNNEVDTLAHKYMSIEIANLLKEADEAVDPRVVAAQHSMTSTTVGSGGVQLSAEQFQTLLAAASNNPRSVSVSMDPHSSAPLLMQYQPTYDSGLPLGYVPRPLQIQAVTTAPSVPVKLSMG